MVNKSGILDNDAPIVIFYIDKNKLDGLVMGLLND